MLGRPGNHASAVLRLCLPTALFSAFLNNTPIVAMLLSVTEQWCARAGLNPAVLLMPLSFASILGGLTTLIGTSTNLVLNSQLEADPDAPCAPFGFFTMTPAALPAALAGCVLLSLLAPPLLGSSAGCCSGGIAGGDQESGANGGDAQPVASGGFAAAAFRGYRLDVVVMSGCELIDEPVASLVRLAGSASSAAKSPPAAPSSQRGRSETVDAEANSNGGVRAESPDPVAAAGPTILAVLGVTRANGSVIDMTQTGPFGVRFHVDDVVHLCCAAQVVPRLRRVKALKATPEEASLALGDKRRHRCLHEAVLAATSPLVGLDVSTATSNPLLDHTAVWGVQRARTPAARAAARSSRNVSGLLSSGPIPSGPLSSLGLSSSVGGLSPTASVSLRHIVNLPSRDASLITNDSAASEQARSIAGGASGRHGGGGGRAFAADTEPLRVGDTLLLEADESFSARRGTDPHYALLNIVPASMPPRESTSKDTMRLVAALGCLVALLALSATDTVQLLPLALLLAFFLVSIKCLTPDQAWRSINYRVLLTIMCSFGLGSALSNTGVSNVIASALRPIGEDGGPLVFLLAVFFLTSILSCIVSNSATVVLLYHVLRLVRIPHLHPAQPLLALMLGASCAFATPIGYQTNLMVLTRGGYRFGDFGLLGGLLTIVVGVTAALCIWMLPESMLPAARNITTAG